MKRNDDTCSLASELIVKRLNSCGTRFASTNYRKLLLVRTRKRPTSCLPGIECASRLSCRRTSSTYDESSMVAANAQEHFLEEPRPKSSRARQAGNMSHCASGMYLVYHAIQVHRDGDNGRLAMMGPYVPQL